MRCRDCALVTSSGHLLRSRRGAQIDRAECVIRMNDAPTRGYGRDVGHRTSLRVIAHSSIQRILRNRHDLLNVSQGTVFVFWGPSSYMRRDGKGRVYNNLQLLSQVLPRLKAFMITRHKMLRFDELFKRETGKDRKISNTWLSTGWFTMTIALELCDRVNVYGMVPPDFCRSKMGFLSPPACEGDGELLGRAVLGPSIPAPESPSGQHLASGYLPAPGEVSRWAVKFWRREVQGQGANVIESCQEPFSMAPTAIFKFYTHTAERQKEGSLKSLLIGSLILFMRAPAYGQIISQIPHILIQSPWGISSNLSMFGGPKTFSP
ncbi:alpha-N-acetylgalactosaminide alpha-2,6-sialyltransferase 5 isoform X1 [Carlito syrichta]|uniref:Alpha-N-acetylgalactosaminide alpha-2,6-sialyltransferase 5 isoform X1 n=1 Tax=Carlito syrichta TaxID=1868482 RepID=A0A3Q0DZY1_CARSF|nr:alpha-N-acetylgalactosaminide alpha-2,6-sialyltransferase 5 isoform X1 [Carlito syrichta]